MCCNYFVRSARAPSDLRRLQARRHFHRPRRAEADGQRRRPVGPGSHRHVEPARRDRLRRTVGDAIRMMAEGALPASADCRSKSKADGRFSRPRHRPLSGRPFSGNCVQPAARSKGGPSTRRSLNRAASNGRNHCRPAKTSNNNESRGQRGDLPPANATNKRQQPTEKPHT